MTKTFGPEVQYRDWHGTAEADDADFDAGFRGYMRRQGLLSDGDFLIAIRGTNAENTSRRGMAPVYVTALVIPATDFEAAQRYIAANDPLLVREVAFEMPVLEWAALFKRFSVAMAWQSLKVLDREIVTNQ